MGQGGMSNTEPQKFQDALLAEIFAAYQESGTVYQKTGDPEIRRTVLDLKRCYDLVIQRLLPLGAPAEKLWEELQARFSD